jgi:hypothetical protein
MPSRKQSRKQRGGGWGYNGPAFMSSAGAPVDSRVLVDGCNPPMRVVPQIGGGCGCMRMDPSTQKGGGGGTGGYTADVATNDLGKVPVYVPGSCQRGGMAPLDYSLVGGVKAHVSESEIGTHTAGYSSITPVELPAGSRYMNVLGYASKGGRRRSRRQRKNRKTTRRHK